MTRNDERILEYLAIDERTVSPVSAVGGYAGLELDGQPVSILFRRLPILFAAGLIAETADGQYAIAEKGQQYLAGDLDATELDTPEGLA